MNKTKKIAILGANGFIGKNLTKYLLTKKEMDLTLFSHNPTDKQLLNLEIKKININFNFIIFLLNSYNQKQFDDIYNLLVFLSKNNKTKIILISSLSVNSKIRSKYVINKLKLESVVKKNNKNIILRVGFVHSPNYSSYQTFFSKLRSKKILIVPGGNYKTGFITLNSLSLSIYNLLKYDESKPQIKYLINEVLPINLYLRVRNFRGILISLPLPSFDFCAKFINYFVTKLPYFVQSFLVLSSNSLDFKERETDYYFLKKIFLFDYFKTNKEKIYHKNTSIKYYIKNYIKLLGNENYLYKKNIYKFLYQVRLNELLNLSHLSNKKNIK